MRARRRFGILRLDQRVERRSRRHGGGRRQPPARRDPRRRGGPHAVPVREGQEQRVLLQRECARVWPPYTTKGGPKASEGAEAAKLGTLKRDDGSTQVTYNGAPLYLYASDTQAGEANGNQLDQFGAEWYALHPSGEKAEGSQGGGGTPGGGQGSGGGGGYY
jgi:hypothetical protein